MVDPKYVVALEKPCVYFDPDFLPKQTADEYFQDLLTTIKWEKTSKINRWVSLHHAKDLADYQYRDAPGAAHLGFTQTIEKIQKAVEDWYQQQTGESVEFNVCLLNYYESGQQRIGWHSDREEIGRTTPIASISLGTPRQFQIRNKTAGPQDRASFDMPNGSLVIMENICQHEYLHSIPKQPSIATGRINLTFRCKSYTTEGEEEHERRNDWLSNITAGAEPSAHAWSAAPTNSERTDVFGSSAGSTGGIYGDFVHAGDLDSDFPHIYFLVKTNLGTERYCGAEIEELLTARNADSWRVIARPVGMDGLVACCCSGSSKAEFAANHVDEVASMIKLLLGLKSAHHVIDYHMDFQLENCCNKKFPTPELVNAETLYEYFKEHLIRQDVVVTSLEQLAASGGGTFRATCDRIGGPHAFQSPQVEMEMGGSLAEYYAEQNVRPKMEDYDVCIRIEIVGFRAIVGTQLNVSDLSKDRHFLKFRNAVTVKTNIAYAMVRLGNVQPGQTIMDPFCGSGTLLLEALEIFRKKVYCIGMDVSKRSASGARDNALAEGCGHEVCKFVCSDARGLRRHVTDESVDAIISNLPWGVQTGQKNSVSDLKTLYEIFLRTSWYTLKPGGRIVMLVLRGLQITRIVRKLSGRYRLLNVTVIRTTNNLPSVVVIEKLARDELRENIKSQLAYMNQYVNVSPEIYHAIHMEAVDDEDN